MTATSRKDRECLRRLAAEVAEITNSPRMKRAREVWRKSNRLEERTIPFVIEDNGSFFEDILPKTPECEGDFERGLERGFRHIIANHRLIDDDRIFHNFCAVNWRISRPDICPELKFTRVPDLTGRMLGFDTNTPLADLKNSFHKLRRLPFSVDRAETYKRLETATAAFGDILPVKLVGWDVTGAGCGMAYKAVMLMGMDNLFMLMMDQPEEVHRFFDFVATESSEFIDWLEAEKLITPNNGENWVGSGSIGYTDELPRRKINEGEAAKASDCWGFIEAQEATGLSPETYGEFINPYQKRLGDRFGLVYYGCCEPVHDPFHIIMKINNIRKITVSPWCDQRAVAAAAGKKVVLSRKPHPMKLCGEKFNAKEFEEHIQETLEIAKDNFVELIFRDTNPLNGSMKDRLAEACKIVRRLIGRQA